MRKLALFVVVALCLASTVACQTSGAAKTRAPHEPSARIVSDGELSSGLFETAPSPRARFHVPDEPRRSASQRRLPVNPRGPAPDPIE